MKITKYFFLLITVFYGNNLLAQTNLLVQNKELINRLAEYETVSEIDSNFIKYQKKMTINYGFGVANKKVGKVIYEAQNNVSYFIKAYGKYIAMVKLSEFNKSLFGLINAKGQTVLDFKYDRIGSVFVSLPDSLITVQMGNKFGVFNTNTAKLSAIKYDNTDNVLNDSYSYHEGGANIAQKIIYSQLGLANFMPKIIEAEDYKTNANINIDDTIAYLVNKQGEKISKNYDTDLETIYGIGPHEFYIGAVKDLESKNENARKLFVLNGKGKEIAEISSHQNEVNRYYIALVPNKKYYFIETDKTVNIPDGYLVFVSCYLSDGFMGFSNLKTRQKLFVDIYGNQQIVGDLPVEKPAVITQNITENEVIAFKKLTTENLSLGRVTKYQYNTKGKLFKETGFDFDGFTKPEMSWEDTYYYDKLDSIAKVTRYDGNEVYDLPTDDGKGKTQRTYNTKKQQTKIVFTDGDYKFEKRFVYNNLGNMMESTELYNDKINNKTLYQYNSKNLLVTENKFRDKQLDYTYKTTYNAKNRKIKYDMINAKGVTTGIWLYQYNDKNELLYKIDLYGIIEKKELVDVEGVAPGPPLPPPAPKKAN